MKNHEMHHRSLRRLLILGVFPAALVLVPLEVVEAQSLASRPGQSKTDIAPKGYDAYFASGAFLVSDEAVRRDLGVTLEQAKLLDRANDELGVKMRLLGDRIAEMKRQKISVQKRMEFERFGKQAIYEGLAGRVFEVLTPEQERRLRQLHLQFAGLSSLHRSEVASRVGIPESIRKEVGALTKAHRQKMTGRYRAIEKKYYGSMYEGVRQHTAQEKKELAALRKAYASAEGDAQDRLWVRIMDIENRARKFKRISQNELIDRSRQFQIQVQAWKEFERKEGKLLEERLWGLLDSSQKAAWERLIGSRIQFTRTGP